MKEGAELYQIIADIYDQQKDNPSVNPISLANAAMDEIHFPRRLHELGWIGCHLQLRQIARSFCRQQFDPTGFRVQDDLFPETLHERYPTRTKANEEPEYVLLDQLSDDDVLYNVERMRRAAFALQRHADALEAWHLHRRRMS